MIITRGVSAEYLKGYLNEQVSLEELVAWAEDVMMDGKIADSDFDVVRDVIARLGVADVAAFGLTWEEARNMLESLGYRPKVAFEAV